MSSKLLCFAASLVALAIISSPAVAQDEVYKFDGVSDEDPQPADPTDWMTSENWNDGGADPFPPFGPSIPDLGTRVEIRTSTFGVDAPVIGPGDVAEAHGVRIGRVAGEGLLTMTGGTLDTADSCTPLPFKCNLRVRVGAAEGDTPAERLPGTFNLSGGVVTADTLWVGSGSYGEMNMSGGEVNTRGSLSFDWTFDAGSVLNMTAGVINVGSSLRMFRQSLLNIDGGSIFVSGFAGLGYTNEDVTQTPNVTVNINSGLLESASYLRVEGSVVVDGGILRANSFNEALSTGTVEINAGGILQFDNTQESIAAVQSLITSGYLTTIEASPLVVEIVNFEGTDYTQVSSIGAGLAGDFDGDDDVDGLDFLKWQRGESPGPLSASDLSDWETNYGTVGGALLASTTVPEPTAVALAMLAGIALILRRPNL